MGRFLLIVRSMVFLFCILFMVQVSSANAANQKAPSQAEQVSKADDPAGQTEDDKAGKKEEKYTYNPAGKTDPFESFLVKTGGVRGKNLSAREEALDDAESIVSTGEPETELERIEISKLTLTSIIKGKTKAIAMVVDPKGKGYFLEKGTKIGTQSGFVDDIIDEQKKTDFGIEVIKKVIIKVPYRDRNKNIIYRSVEMEMSQASM